MPPADRTLRQGPLHIVSTDPSQLDEIHEWVHDRSYDPSEIRYKSAEHVLEVPFLCTVYQEPRGQGGVFPLISWWWVPVVRGYLQIHAVRDYSVRDDGPGILNELSVPGPDQFRISGISEISGVIDRFQVSVHLRNRIVGWVRMRWLLIGELEGRMEAYDAASDDLRCSS
jgi:hypothetical protein